MLSFHITSHRSKHLLLSFSANIIMNVGYRTVLVPFELHRIFVNIMSLLFDHQHSLKYCILRSTEESIFIFG